MRFGTVFPGNVSHVPEEVPQYGTLLELVADVNLAVLENNPQLHEKMENAERSCARLNVERHGAIRVGTAQEARYSSADVCHYGDVPGEAITISQAGVPVHSTAFGPLMMLLRRVIPSRF
ncbi:2-oxoadipate dioxygenase/decarboxylase family protein [Escherichia coli]